MSHAINDWLNEASGDIAGGQQPPMSGGGALTNAGTIGDQPPGDPNVAAPAPPQNDPAPVMQQQNSMPDVSGDPAAPDMPQDMNDQDFEQWKNKFFKES